MQPQASTFVPESEFRDAWEMDFKNKLDRPLALITPGFCFLGDPTSVPVGQYLTVCCYTAYPYSRGHVHITGPSLSDAPDFDLGFFTDPGQVDVKMHVWAYKKQREIIRRTEFYRGEVASRHPAFAPGSKAATVQLESHDSEAVTENLEYSIEDDAAIEDCVRKSVGTTWHCLGTTKMAPREEMGVVDADLNVYGVKGLKVIDMGIVAKNVASNTNNTALVIGEKGADIIIRELGLL